MRTSRQSKVTGMGGLVKSCSARGSGTNYEEIVPDNSVPDRYYTDEEYQAMISVWWDLMPLICTLNI